MESVPRRTACRRRIAHPAAAKSVAPNTPICSLPPAFSGWLPMAQPTGAWISQPPAMMSSQRL
jgi:hypothetical protein